MTNNHSNSNSSPDDPQETPEDSDLSFASDSHLPFGPSDRAAFLSSGQGEDAEKIKDSEWTSEEQPAASDSDHHRSDTDQLLNVDETWVSSEVKADTSGRNLPEEISAEEIDLDGTWVLPDQSSSETHSNQTETGVDPNKTWVPSSTPTTDGLPVDPQVPSSDAELFEKTWPVPRPPKDDSNKASEAHDPEDGQSDIHQTFQPSSSPTVDGFHSAGAENPEKTDPDRTWVPSSTPTADGLPSDSQASDSDAEPFDKTWVIPTAPATGNDSASNDPQSLNETDDDGSRTWGPSATPTTPAAGQISTPTGLPTTVYIQPGEPNSLNENAVEKTVQLGGKHAQPQKNDLQGTTSPGHSGDVFQKTIGMRRPLDVSDLPPSAHEDYEGGRTIHLDLPDNEAACSSSHPNQLWSRQSGVDLNQSLTIRSRPVAGDSHFDVSKAPHERPDYQIVEKIGEGGMGAIFLATQTSLDRQLAIKTLKAPRGGQRSSKSKGQSSSADQQRRDMFLAEALITANLVHPHIIPIHDLCETAEGLPFYSMKRVVGTPWCDRLQDMSIDENLEVLMKVCDAIAYAHHNGVVNRDLKPENVMLGEFGEVLVLDWGLAVPSSSADKRKFNSPSAPYGAGTPAYMAPELWTGPEEVIGYWSDIYLLGGILFEIITGKTPHRFSESPARAGNTGLWMVIDKVVRQNQIRPTEHQGELLDIALKAMETRPKDRFESVLKFQEALKQFQNHEESRRLTDRASETLKSAEAPEADSGYLGYQSAAALFEEAQTAWNENTEAAEGLRKTRLKYAELAHQKGDYDLGLQIASLEDGVEFTGIRQTLSRSRRFRNALKSTVMGAAVIIVAVGIFSFIQSREISAQNKQIIALNGTRESLQADITTAQNEIIDAEQKRKAAEEKAIVAEERSLAASEEAIAASLKVADANRDLAASEQKLQAADTQLASATTKLKEADVKLLAANEMLQQTELKVADLQVKKSRSAVDLKNAEIAGLIRNGDYSSALSEVERLLVDLNESPEMNSLPDSERQQRKTELQARRRQLLHRAVVVPVPVQSQVINKSGTQIVWADQSGKVQIRNYSNKAGVADQPHREVQFQAPASALVATDTDHIVLAAVDSVIKVWNSQAKKTTELRGHKAKITSLQSVGDFAISADQSGSIRAWSLRTSKQLWSLRSSSRIVDLVLLPEDKVFIYAGSRGGESADILAYQLNGFEESSQRPTRLGQLKLPRNRNDPPVALAVSPDGKRLLISNSRNGRVLVLPKRQILANAGRDQFPFSHATDLDAKLEPQQWVANRHSRPVNQIQFNADGSRFCTASNDRTIGVWQFQDDGSPELIERLEGHGARVTSASFTDPQGQQLLSVSADRYCRFWDVEHYQTDKKKLEREFQLSMFVSPAHHVPTPSLLTQPVVTKPVTRNGQLHAIVGLPSQLATILASRIFTNRMFSLPTVIATKNLQISSHPHRRMNAQQNTNTSKNRVLTASDRQSAAMQTFNAAPSLQRGAMTSVVVSADGKLLTTGSRDGTAVIWDTKTGRPVTSVSTLKSPSKADSPTPPASLQATDVRNAEFDEGHDFNVSRFYFLPPNGKHLLTTGFDGNLCIWNADTEKGGTGHQTFRLPGLGLVNAIAASANGKYVLTSAISESLQPGNCSVYRMADLLSDDEPQPVSEFTGFHTAEISAISVDSEGRFAVTGGRDGRIALWSCADGRQIAAGRIHTKNTIVSNLKLMDDGHILTAGYDGRLLLLKAKVLADSNRIPTTFDVIRRFIHDPIPIERLTTHPNQRQFVTISIRTDKKTRKTQYELSAWDISDAKPTRKIAPAIVEGRAPVRISSINFSSDGKQLAAVVDQRIQIMNTETWKVVRVVGASGTGISDAIFSPTNKREPSSQKIATFNGIAAQLWDLKSGTQLAEFRPLFSVVSLAHSKHNRPLLLTGERSIRLFQADAGSHGFGRCVFKIEDPHSGIVNALAFNPVKKNQFASSGTDGTVCYWRWQQDQTAAALIRRVSKTGAQSNAVAVCWCPNGKHLWVADQLGRLRRLDEGGNTIVDSQILADQNVELADLAIGFHGRFVAVCGKTRNSELSTAWILEQVPAAADGSEKLVVHCRLDGHDAGGINGIRFLPNSPYVVTAGADGACLVWNYMPERSAERPVEAYEAFQFLSLGQRVAHAAPINAISVTHQGHVATVSDDGTARLWQNPFQPADSDTAADTSSGQPSASATSSGP